MSEQSEKTDAERLGEALGDLEQAEARIRELEGILDRTLPALIEGVGPSRREAHDSLDPFLFGQRDAYRHAADMVRGWREALTPPSSEPAEGEDARLDKNLVERGAIPEWSSPYYIPPQRGDALVLVDEVESYGHASAHTRKDLQRFRENCGALRRALAEAIPAEVMEILREAKNDASKLMWHYNAQGDLPQEMTYANKISLIDRALAQSEQGRVPDQPDVGVIIRMVTEYNKTYRSTKNGGDAMRAAIEVWRKAAAAAQPQDGESDG